MDAMGQLLMDRDTAAHLLREQMAGYKRLRQFEIEEAKRATTYHGADFTIRLPSPEDLIVLKAVANRPLKIKRTSVTSPQRIRHWTEIVSSTG